MKRNWDSGVVTGGGILGELSQASGSALRKPSNMEDCRDIYLCKVPRLCGDDE